MTKNANFLLLLLLREKQHLFSFYRRDHIPSRKLSLGFASAAL